MHESFKQHKESGVINTKKRTCSATVLMKIRQYNRRKKMNSRVIPFSPGFSRLPSSLQNVFPIEECENEHALVPAKINYIMSQERGENF